MNNETDIKFTDNIKNLKFFGFGFIIAILFTLLYSLAIDETRINKDTAEYEPLPIYPDEVSNNLQNTESIRLFECDNLKSKTIRRKDYMIIKKYITTWEDTMQPYISGITEENKLHFNIPVTLDSFNRLQDGYELLIEYDEINLNGRTYIVEPTILGRRVGD